MAKTRTARRYTDAAVEASATMSKDDYKRVKHMDKIELVNYLRQIYISGYNDGYKAAEEKHAAPAEQPEE